MQSKHNLFKYSLKEAIINLIKIKSSDQMFTACVCIGWLIDWCLTSSKQLFSYIQDENI